MLDDLPAFGICGWSGSGKTTLIEQIVPRLSAKGLKVAVVKHDTHGLDVDHPGKDSDRFFRAGADVLLQGPQKELIRIHRGDGGRLSSTLKSLSVQYDLVLVEGHKSTPLPKVWLLKVWVLREQEQAVPIENFVLLIIQRLTNLEQISILTYNLPS